MATLAVLLPSWPPSRALWKPIFRWLSCAISCATLIQLFPMATYLFPVTVSVSDWRLNVPAQSNRTTLPSSGGLFSILCLSVPKMRSTAILCLMLTPLSRWTIQRGRFQDTTQGWASFPSLHTDDSWGHIGCCLFCFCALTEIVWLPLSGGVVGRRSLLLDAFMPNPLCCIDFSSALQFC